MGRWEGVEEVIGERQRRRRRVLVCRLPWLEGVGSVALWAGGRAG